MNKDVKKMWVEALRSGEYRQARTQLRDGDSLCCLGVLCDLRDNSYWTGNIYDGEMQTLPNSVSEWAGLESDNPKVGKWALSELNDGVNGGCGVRPHSFSEIADMIEAEL